MNELIKDACSYQCREKFKVPYFLCLTLLGIKMKISLLSLTSVSLAGILKHYIATRKYLISLSFALFTPFPSDSPPNDT